MSEVLGLEHFSLGAEGPTLSLSVAAGQSIAVVGHGGAGKTRFLRMLAGIERPGQGAAHRRVETSVANGASLSRRSKPQSLARAAGSVNQAGPATELLSALNLWDDRQRLIGDLSPSRVAACELLEPLASAARLVLIDGQMDRLDVWALHGLLELMQRARAAGRTFIYTTNRPELAAQSDTIVVLKHGQIRFAGTVDDLLRAAPQHRITVHTENQPGVRALAAPFQVAIEDTSEGLVLCAPEGQTLAARLLLDGYGDVEYIVMKRPSVAEALLNLA